MGQRPTTLRDSAVLRVRSAKGGWVGGQTERLSLKQEFSPNIFDGSKPSKMKFQLFRQTNITAKNHHRILLKKYPAGSEGSLGIYNLAKVRNDRLIGCLGLFFCIRQDLPDTIKVNLNILSAFSVNLYSLMNGHFVDELVEYLRRKLGDL